ncbi:hypothetical protein F4604DRAFT_1587405, partial [Suillus subluteus]
IDEVSKDERTLGRHYGRSSRGKRAHAHQPFVRGRRVSLEALLTLCRYLFDQHWDRRRLP